MPAAHYQYRRTHGLPRLRQNRTLRAPFITFALLVASVLMMAGAMWHPPAIEGSGEMSKGANATADWPPLTLIYRSDAAVVRLDYQDARRWRKEVVENSRDPSSVGTVMSFGDTTVRHHPANTVDASTGQASVYEEPVTGGIEVPERWLHPGFAAILQQKHFVASAGEAPDTVVYQQVIPAASCPAQEAGHPPIPQPAACETGDTYREVETWTFRTDVTPPMAIAGRSEADGQVQWRVEVVSVEPAP